MSSWINQVKGLNFKEDFSEKVIEILTPNIIKSLPHGWQNISTEQVVFYEY